jgi:glycosyltransferase involved in cell wall biosynthesis
LLAGLIGANRPKVIAVFGTTRAEVECAIRHARTSAASLPIWAWCAEESAPVAGCERFTAGARAFHFANDLRRAWPALSIVAWTGKRGCIALKLLPLAFPPFRVVLFNEAEGFFAARPALIAGHLKWRLRDKVAAFLQLIVGAFQLLYSLAFRAGQHVRDWFNVIGSLAWRTGEGLFDALNWIRESLFAVLAYVARWSAPLSYAAVGRVRNGRPVSLEESPDDDFLDVEIPNRGWPRRSVMAAATRSDAEFIVLRMRGERGSAESLIAIARQTNAFAVGKQSAHAAWRKRVVVTKHPFRRLRENEVSEVRAPFSPLLVLRRKTLVRLGFPRAFTYGGALMILFWKSSAAGLRSLVVGHEGMVGDESAMALEDAELAFCLSVSPSLAAIGPERPARFRGNVAWSPLHTKGFRGHPRVLVVSPYLPFPLSHGGAVRIYNLCRSLADRVDFVLACFHEAGETVCYQELHEIFREVYVVDADERRSDPDVPKQVAEYRNGAMSDLIRSLSRRVDLVQLEYTQMAEYREDTGALPVILVEHDITFTLYSQLADFNPDPQTRNEYSRWLDFERIALQCSNQVWTMSDEERSIALDHGASRHRTKVIPNGVDLRRFTPAPKPAGPPAVLFVGSFRHLPNLLAFELLRSSIMPAVWRECPDAVLHAIAGPHHERAAELAGKTALLTPHPRIVIEGFVEDVRPAYRAASVVAVPLPVSAGTNIKLLEAMACGRPILSTPAGCRGLGLTSGVELVIAEVAEVAESGSCFSAALVNLLRDEDLRTRLALAARTTAELRFGWDRIAEDALDSYITLTAADMRLLPAASVSLPQKRGW